MTDNNSQQSYAVTSNEEVYRRTLEQVRASLMPFLNGRSNDLAAANIRLIDEALARPAHETSALLVGKPAIDKLAHWLIHEDECAAVDGTAAAFENPCSCGLDEAIAAVQGSPVEPFGKHPGAGDEP
jgi:hypothetical protein